MRQSATKIQPTKRQQITDEAGWTHVVDAPRRKRDPGNVKASWQHASDFEVNGVSYVNRTLEEMRSEFEQYQKEWKASWTHDEVLKLSLGAAKINNVVCLGMGSLQVARREGRRTSHTQLAALASIIQLLGT